MMFPKKMIYDSVAIFLLLNCILLLYAEQDGAIVINFQTYLMQKMHKTRLHN